MAIFSIGFGIALFGTGDLIVVKSNVYVFSENDVLWRIIGAYLFSLLSMGAVAGLAFLFSAFVNNAIGPIVSTITVIICFMIISNIDLSLFKMLKPFMFTTYMAKWMLFFETPLNKKELIEAVVVLLLHIALFFGITVLYFRKKDILT
jgi:ABC-2 type transport system permease protein